MSNYPDDATYDRIHGTVTQVARCAIANAIHAEVSGEVHHLVYNAVAGMVNSSYFDEMLDQILDQIFDPAPLDDEQAG
jgi:hypothetical protein